MNGSASEDSYIGMSETQPFLPLVTIPNQQVSRTSGPSGAVQVAAAISAPIITEQPTSREVGEGQWVELRVSAQAPYPSVQWYRNSVPVPGATNGSYFFQFRSQLPVTTPPFSITIQIA